MRMKFVIEITLSTAMNNLHIKCSMKIFHYKGLLFLEHMGLEYMSIVPT